MSRISIDVTPEQHKRLKAMAALAGKSIKEFVLERTVLNTNPSSLSSAEDPLKELEKLRSPEPKSASSEDSSGERFDSIMRDVYYREPPS